MLPCIRQSNIICENSSDAEGQATKTYEEESQYQPVSIE